MKKLNLKLPALPYMMEEAFKKLKINFQFVGNDTKKILITSSIPNEGKSFVAVRKQNPVPRSGYEKFDAD
mgnify:CR=1 FL=1